MSSSPDQALATDWKFADVYEAIARAVPGRPAVIHGDRILTWREFERRADALASELVAHGMEPGAKVAAYLPNGPEYLETYFAAFKAGLAPLNCNYRYGAEEMAYLLDNADAEAVVFHATYLPVIERIRDRLPGVHCWYLVGEGDTPLPEWAIAYEQAVSGGGEPLDWAERRSADDLLLLYTGGTTGLPKGVMWRQDDLFNVLGGGGNVLLGVPPPASFDELVSRLDPAADGPVTLITCPLMHGTGQLSALSALSMGGTVLLTASRAFDVAEVWHQASAYRANAVIIVGETFAGPMLEHLRQHREELDLASLRLITSSGVMWSHENKEALLAALPGVVLFDNFGSSEAVGVGGSVSRSDRTKKTAEFKLGRNTAVFTEDGRRVTPGSAERGLVAISGYIPLGYYKDPDKTRQTFRIFEGRRWSVPGDWVEVGVDGTIRLLGRGSTCINTGGEKVFPEEIEEILKTHPSVRDAVVIGVPDRRFGEAICALIEPGTGVGEETIVAADLPGMVKRQLAPFKAPRHVVVIDSMKRAPNGKVDHAYLRQVARERLGLEP